MRTRRGIRTPNLRGLSAVPLPFELPGQGFAPTYVDAPWTERESNPCCVVCKTTLYTGTLPVGRSRTLCWERRIRTSTSWFRANHAAWLHQLPWGRSGPSPPRAGPSRVERLPRIELGCSPWRGDALPLCYSRTVVHSRPCGIRTRRLQVEGLARSPLLQRSAVMCRSVLRGPGGIRTRDLRSAAPVRYLLRYKPICTLNVRGPRVERGGSCSQSRRVDRLPHPGCVPPVYLR